MTPKEYKKIYLYLKMKTVKLIKPKMGIGFSLLLIVLMIGVVVFAIYLFLLKDGNSKKVL